MLINDASITGSLIVNASASFQNINVAGNIIPDTTNIHNLGSTDKYFKEIYVSTGSINFVDETGVIGTLNAGTITAIQSNTSSANNRLDSIESVSASLQTFTASVFATNTFTSSATARLNALESTSASVDTLNTTQNARLSSLETTSASVDITNTTQDSRLNSLENKTGSLATTGSNTFIGTQIITGSLYVTTDLIVQGSSSLQNITASAVSIGTNIVNLNTATPAIRYAGLVVGDSGSVGGSGSFLYDSVQDEMIFVHRGTSTVVTSSVVLMGPQTYDNVGTETYPTNNRIQKGTGNEHLADSNISDDGTKVTITGGLDVTGAVSASTFTGLGNLTTYSSSVDSRIVTNTNSAAGAFASASAYSASAASRMLVFATTGSNTFTNNQIVSGTFTATGNIKSDGVVNWNGNIGALSYGGGNVTMETNTATPILIKTNGTTAITISTGQASTFAGDVYGNSDLYTKNALRFNGTGLNSSDKKLYSPTDGVLEWFTHDLAGEHAFAVSHQGTKRVYLNTTGNSYLNGGNVGINDLNPPKKLTVNFGTTANDGLLVSGSQRQETRFKSSGEHSNVFIDSAHSNIYLPTLSFQRNSSTFGEVRLQRASNSDSIGSFTESEMIVGSTTSVPLSLKTNEIRRVQISSGGNVTVYNSLSVNGNFGARNFNNAIKSWSSNGSYTWSTEFSAISGYFDSACWYKGFIRESNGAHYNGYQFDIHVGQIGYGGAANQFIVRNITYAGGPWTGGCGGSSFAAIDNSGFTKQNSGCFDSLELFITRLG